MCSLFLLLLTDILKMNYINMKPPVHITLIIWKIVTRIFYSRFGTIKDE